MTYPIVFLDEAGYYFANNDQLKEQLRTMPGVPNAQYLSRDGKVFVFDKLVRLVSAAGMSADGKVDPVQVAKLLPQAWVEPELAVVSFDVVPEPYELVDKEGAVAIRHRPFNALLPGSYASKTDAQKALVKLLVGEVIRGEGQFEYRGQPMTLQHSFELQKLPARPFIDVDDEGDAPYFWRMDVDTYCPGLPPLSADAFTELVNAHNSWSAKERRAQKRTRAASDELWRDAVRYSLASLNDLSEKLPEYGFEDGAELRRLYPELSMLGDGSLYSWYSSFADDCLCLRGWTPARDDDFLFFLLGKVARGHEANGYYAREAGLMAGFALLCGSTVADALRFGIECSLYRAALGAMAGHARSAMRFLAQDKDAPPLQGSKVTTMLDLFRAGRSVKSRFAYAEQSLSDFETPVVQG
ncbi:hypothetical protein F6X40_11010 [Paraburkholderia sp. UCT31]|uniref:hypothetical protein n=1 Tax=Paraburkholderia sp. UCT31 TaxID=2615209 RepID=UPI00165673EC|nr:hypothetical protein [Paraburkholderia sp. UCT31]MBC8737332.1 hypothetical protein [Paraburkholderia sp. UCT31]